MMRRADLSRIVVLDFARKTVMLSGPSCSWSCQPPICLLHEGNALMQETLEVVDTISLLLSGRVSYKNVAFNCFHSLTTFQIYLKIKPELYQIYLKKKIKNTKFIWNIPNKLFTFERVYKKTKVATIYCFLQHRVNKNTPSHVPLWIWYDSCFLFCLVLRLIV